MFNTILNHVGMLWIIRSNDETQYVIDKSNDKDWLINGHWYNPDICPRFHGSLFGYFITHARTDRYNLMYSLVAHD